ncbi:hypothetical protein [Pseudonocardia sp. NPDC049635]|uniref:hypothetical protein n=1 Tax=Pseudonocardia sp. NPDC049635 TaxID=3155506 RepID=UPI0033D57804
MAAVIVWTKVEGQEKYKALARRLREASRGDLQRKLTRAIRAEGDPALRAVQGRFRTVDVTSEGPGGSSSGLRARVAAATRISILGSGIRIRVEPKRVDPRHGRTLSFGVNGKYWRHPVFGNTQVWTGQRGQEVFYSTLQRFETRWRAGIERAMDEIARQIEG